MMDRKTHNIQGSSVKYTDKVSPSPHIAVIGAGIAGLTAAYRLAQRGFKVTVYEASDRVGGKIRSSEERHAARRFEYGAEFINSDDKKLKHLCKELGVDLQESATPDAIDYAYLFNGERYSEEQVQAWYKKLSKTIFPIIEECRSSKEKAAYYDAMPLKAFFENLIEQGADARLMSILEASCLHENGSSLEFQSTLAFLNNLSTDSRLFAPFGVDDEAYRVKGGTCAIIHALENKCNELGVAIATQAPVLSADLTRDQKVRLEIGGKENPPLFDHVVFANSLPKLGNIRGLEKLGFSKEMLQKRLHTQHTNAIKIGFPLQGDPRAGTPLENVTSLITDKSFQACWHIPGNPEKPEHSAKHNSMVVMLVGGLSAHTDIPGLIEQCREDYAALLGKSPEDVFLKGKEPEITLSFGATNGCYVSPAPGEFRHLKKLAKQPEGRASLVGAHIPVTTKHGGTKIGFMECAVSSAEKEAEKIAQLLKRHRRTHAEQRQSVMAH